ncbi:MAG: phage minor capsid protein [Oscillospiraceae bacterium]
MYDITEIFQDIEEELISSMCRNLSRHIDEEQEAQANYPHWQTKQLQALERYRQENLRKFSKQFDSINDSLKKYLEMTYNNAKTQMEYDIMKALSDTIVPTGAIGVNQEKLNALINAITDDFQKAEHSILRRSNDLYRQTIFKAQMGLNTGSMTLNQAIDMATKDFLSNGINSIRYKNGNLVNIASYSEMALRTAEKRATAYGEGEKRQEWNISTVIVYGHDGACPLCSKWQNKVYIDDVWSNGKPNGRYPLLSEAVRGGLYHPNCKDPTPQTYIEGITEPPTPNTKEEIQKNVENYNLEQVQRYNERQIRKYKRLEANSLDENNKKKYALKVKEWQSKQREFINAHPEQLRRDYSREKVRVLNITEPPKNVTEVTPISKKELTYKGIGDIIIGIKTSWKKTSKNDSISKILAKINPDFQEHINLEWEGATNNCQRCVVAFEMQMRGYNVKATHYTGNNDEIKAGKWQLAFKNAIFEDCPNGNGLEDIKNKMKKWGDGARAIIGVDWKDGYSHVFSAEYKFGEVHFYDPQANIVDCEDSFNYVILGNTKIMRVDNLDITSVVLECCEECEDNSND